VTKAAKNAKSAQVALNYIGKLYKIEHKADALKLSFDERKELRQKEAVPILEKFKEWLERKVDQVPPKSLLGKAIYYTLGQWDRLERYVENGILTLDNNLAENAIRPYVVGRKNWLFNDTPYGAFASATLYSLIETAKANGLEPYWYFRYLFEHLPRAGSNPDDLRRLLPQALDMKIIASPQL